MESQEPSTSAHNWPGAFGIFKQASAAAKKNLWALLGLNLLTIVASGISNGGEKQDVTWYIILIASLVSIWLQLALISNYLAGVRDKTESFADSLQAGLKHFVNGFIATLVTAFLLVLSIIALVIPFFFVVPRLQLVLYYLVDQNMGPIEAIKASWENSKGYSLKVWGVIAVSLLFAVLCLVLVGIYLLFMYQTAFALLYLFINKNAGGATEADITPAPAE
jgi:hypothetical protein